MSRISLGSSLCAAQFAGCGGDHSSAAMPDASLASQDVGSDSANGTTMADQGLVSDGDIDERIDVTLASQSDASDSLSDAAPSDVANGDDGPRDARVEGDDVTDALVDGARASGVTENASDADLADEGPVDAGAVDALGDGEAATDALDTDVSTVSILQSTRGTDCLQCAEATDAGASCLSQFNCEALSRTVISEAGQSRQQLCYDALFCSLSANCAAMSLTGCYCGSASPTECQKTSGAANGACVEQERAGLETADPFQIFVLSYYDTTLGAGVANSLLHCLSFAHCNCFNEQ